MRLRNIRLTLAYDGAPFLGWEESLNGPTIEGELKKALSQIIQEPPFLQAASRTDRGVHAKNQEVNFFTQNPIAIDKLLFSLNSLLPSSIRVMTLQETALSFHPTLDATAKSYQYNISLGPIQPPHDRYFAWHVPQYLDTHKMKQALPLFLGRKDFSSFCNVSNVLPADYFCTIHELKLQQEVNSLIFQVKGDRFLYKMVRNIVGTLVDIGRGKIPLEDLNTIIMSRSRPRAGITAPAHGLMLMQIYYPPEITDQV